MSHLTSLTHLSRRLVALLVVALLATVLSSGAPAHAASAAPASSGGPSAAACVWNYSFWASVPHNGGFAYATNSAGTTEFYIAGCGGVILRASNLNYGTRVYVVRCSDNSSLGFADIKLLNTNYTVTNQFLAAGTCVRLEMQKLPNQPAGVATYPVSGSAAT
jgi:hypothetical protein